MRPCQSTRGLPRDVADWLRRWVRRPGVAGRCFEAMRDRPASVAQHRGLAVFARDDLPNGMIHTWGTWGGRVVDPTAHQVGVGPLALYRMHAVCPTCGRAPAAGDATQDQCWCFRAPGLLPLLVPYGPAYEELGAPDIATLIARLGARRAA